MALSQVLEGIETKLAEANQHLTEGVTTNLGWRA